MNECCARMETSWGWTWELLKGLGRRRRGAAREGLSASARDPRAYFDSLSGGAYAEKHRAGNDPLICKAFEDCLGGNRIVEKMVELGCGNGDLMNFALSRLDCYVTGVDFSLPFLISCKERLKARKERFGLLQADLRSWLPSESKSADLIACVNVLPYLEELENLAMVCYRMLRKGGVALVIYPRESLVWEKNFDGVELVFHEPTEIDCVMSDAQLSRISHRRLGFRLPALLGGFRVAIAYADLFAAI